MNRISVGRIAAVTASFAIAATGAISMAAPASAAPAVSCNAPHYLTGSAGHKGASVQCYGNPFTEAIRCQRTDTGFQYTHFGNRAVSGGTSTTWCDLTAVVIDVGTIDS